MEDALSPGRRAAAPPWQSPLFWPLAPWLARLSGVPDQAAVDELARRFPVATGNGHQVAFVPPQDDGLTYECRVWERGEVETRPDNWHDFFNALVWLSFPQAKQAITAAHVAAMQAPGAPRGMRRDALTHFDECGLAICSTNPELLELLRRFQWRDLFVRRRAEVIGEMRFVIFGHAIYESLLNPFRGLTAKGMLLDVAADFPGLDPAAQVAAVDARLAAEIRAERYPRPRDFQPLPLLGIPGVTPDNEDPAYYADTWQFRPGRRTQDRPTSSSSMA